MKKFTSLVTFMALVSAVTPGAGAAARHAAGVPVSIKETSNCSALAPANWSISGNPEGSTLDAESPDHSMYAGWGVVQINRSMQRYYGPMFGDPQTSMQTLASTVVRAKFSDSSPVQYTSAPRAFLRYFAIRSFASQQTHGLVFYHLYPVGDPNSYIESVYLAINSNAVPRSKSMIAQAVAVSIRCQTRLISHAADPTGTRGGKDKPKGCGGEGNLRGYNKELGWQYAHTSGGTNRLFDASEWRNGPQGEGYYATVGNSEEKLELGRSDDC